MEDGHVYDFSALALSGQSTPTEQNLHHLYQRIITSPAVRASDGSSANTTNATAAVTTATAMPKPDTNIVDQTTLSLLSADIDDVMQRTIDAWKNEAMSNNPSNHPEEYLFADILQHNELDQQTMFLRCLGMSPPFGPSVNYNFHLENQQNLATLFRPISQPTTNTESLAASGTIRRIELFSMLIVDLFLASAMHNTYHPQYQSTLNSLMLIQSPIHRSISPSDLSPQQRNRHRSHHHHRHSTNTRRTQTNPTTVVLNEQPPTESNSNNA